MRPAAAPEVPTGSAQTSNILTADELTNEGFTLTRSDNWIGAIKKYEEAIQVDSSYLRAYSNLGYALNRLGNYDRALEVASTGIERADVTDEAQTILLGRLYDVRGFAKSRLKDYGGAINDFSISLDFVPTNPRVLYHRAESKALSGEYDGAYSDVLRSLSLEPDFTPSLRLRKKLEDQGYVKRLAPEA